MIGATSIGWGDSNDEVSEKAIFAAIDRGINFFDTADIYGLGHSEELLGKTIGKNNQIVIATKVGNVSRDERFTVDYSPDHIAKACETSLGRLKRETIDYYQLHTARLTHLQDSGCIEAMEKLQQAGKIRYWGLSLNTFDPLPEANYLMEHAKGSGFQLVLNILNQGALKLIKQASSLGYGIIARMPLQFGLLTGKFDTTINFPPNDHRQNRLTRDVINTANEALAPVWELCQKYSCTKLQLSLSYVLSYTGVSTVIPGIRTDKQAIENTSGLFSLEAEDILMIESSGQTKFAEVMDRIQQQG
jgi:aryl-alcohol dehydrogenase-like predicted oxidoreductase